MTFNRFAHVLFLLAAIPFLAAAQPTLKEAFQDDFLIGAALNPSHFTPTPDPSCEVALVKEQFNSISPENVLKWEIVHPGPRDYNFGPSDAYVNFGVKNNMFIVGHNLIWHQQTPTWVFQNDKGEPLSRRALLRQMREHIYKVVGRYKGRINGWDVANEALAEDGSLRMSRWRKIIGDDYLVKAYQFAHKADPHAQLYYNDYSLENPAKRAGAVALVKKLQAAGIPLFAVGLQGHYKLNWPSPSQIDDTIQAFSALGVKVMITELDVDVLPPATASHAAEVSMHANGSAGLNPYGNGLPEEMQQTLARRYAELFDVFVKHRQQITRVTFWGVTDGDSWLNNWPIRGRTSYPLLFDRDCHPKPAFDSVLATAHPLAPAPADAPSAPAH